jgi:hypothetical protein
MAKRLQSWKSLREKKPQEGEFLYDVLINNDTVVRDCNFVRKGIIFTQIDSGEQLFFKDVNSWRLAGDTHA